jgi:hypothetical protein
MSALPWRTVERKVQARIDVLRDQLEKANDMDAVRRLQGGISELRRVIDLPKELIDDESRRISE